MIDRLTKFAKVIETHNEASHNFLKTFSATVHTLDFKNIVSISTWDNGTKLLIQNQRLEAVVEEIQSYIVNDTVYYVKRATNKCKSSITEKEFIKLAEKYLKGTRLKL